MKTSVVASMLFGALAIAAPLERRARLTKTEVVVTTVTSYVTVYDDEPAPTSSQALFYEQPKVTSSAAPVSSAAPATPAAVNTPAAASPSPVVKTSQPAPPAPATTSAAPPPPPVVTSVAPAPTSAAPAPPAQSSQPSTPATGSDTYTNVDMTVYDAGNVGGACSMPGTVLHDSDMFVAISQGMFGASTYDTATGNPTSPLCNKMIKVTYNGKSITAPIMDRCGGCAGKADVDMSRAAWAAIGITEDTGRFKASWSFA